MGYQELLFSMLIFCPLAAVANVGPPVLLFRDARVDSVIAKPLAGHTLSAPDFSAALVDVKSELMVTFVQDELSNEDFLRLDKDMKRGGLFKNVQKYSNMKNSLYFPSVKSPVHSLGSMVFKYDEQIELNDAKEVMHYLSKTKPQKDTSITIHLQPTADVESSSAAIKKNDELIGEVMNMVEQSGLTYVAFFSGKVHRKSHESAVVQASGRHLLQVEVEEAENNATYFYNIKTKDNKTECLLYIKEMKLGDTEVKSEPSVSCITDNGTATVTIGDNVEMIFKKDAFGYWVLRNATVAGEEAKTDADISAPVTFSYHCSQPTVFTNTSDTSILSFQVIQLQVFDFATEGKFGNPYDCIGFFTIPLWTGLLTALFLIIITIYGLYMLSSIQTFDQFDDPKAKPLTINISE